VPVRVYLGSDHAGFVLKSRLIEWLKQAGHDPVDRQARALEGGELTPVMARLGPADLETLDALITAGIAASRAEAVRWALARIRERPAYAQLRERAREIERLKTEF